MHFLLLIFSLIVTATASDFVVLRTSKGHVRGRRITANYSTSTGTQKGIGFFSIPYAEPPIGALRFRSPVAKVAWNGVLNATRHRAACMSDPVYSYKSEAGGPISEDCLHLNVFTNDYCLKNKNCSVMVAVHGGGFIGETMATFKEDIVVNNFVGQNRNIVLVAMNYRLGFLGMINFAAKNKTLYEQNIMVQDTLLAFKWVRAEVGHFGGDYKKVTAFGHSGGGALVTALSRTKMARGLFGQRIIMSGPLLANNYGTNSRVTLLISKKVGCITSTATLPLTADQMVSTVNCLRDKSAIELLDAQLDLGDTPSDFGGVVVDDELFGGYWEDVEFRKEDARHTMMGTVAAEIRDSNVIFDDRFENFTLIPERLQEMCEAVGYLQGYKNPSSFVQVCTKYYSKDDTARYLSDDDLFYRKVIEDANRDTKFGKNVFVYSFTYLGVGKAFNEYLKKSERPSHSEEFIYMFGTHRGIMTEKDYKIEKIMTGYFANFVNFGNPSPSPKDQKWPRYDEHRRGYFEMDFDDNLNVEGSKNGYYARVNTFWNNIVERVTGGEHHIEPEKGDLDYMSSRRFIEFLGSAWLNHSIVEKKTLGSMIKGRNQVKMLVEQQKSLDKWRKWFKTGNFDEFLITDTKIMAESVEKGKKRLSGVLVGAGLFFAGSILLISVIKIANHYVFKNKNLEMI